MGKEKPLIVAKGLVLANAAQRADYDSDKVPEADPAGKKKCSTI
tara:strand:+ start:408 stop:539 length:132 start_codon:yes stop_codon:yes gene_type:complete